MTERPFLDKTKKPTEKSMQAKLGSTYIYYMKIVGLARSYIQDWTFSKSSGWMLKISNRKKSLLYIIPLVNMFKISLTIREKEREILLQDNELRTIHEIMSTSKKYPEGFAMQFNISSRKDYQPFELLLRRIIAMR